MDWKLYEQRKAELQKENLTPKEYEKKIMQMVKELEVKK